MGVAEPPNRTASRSRLELLDIRIQFITLSAGSPFYSLGESTSHENL